MASGLHTALRPHLRYVSVAAAPEGTRLWVQWSSASSGSPGDFSLKAFRAPCFFLVYLSSCP